ncbi:Transposase IS116/IS110/IS902 family protein [Amycolatopsis sp. YIM 10]|nr:Transposase IS116/IS110/IS902 family protein [Amycolatopsis sp. YIM 10]
MPSIGVGAAARILLDIGNASNFASFAHLAPVTRASGTGIKGEHPARTGNRKTQTRVFLAAFAALHDPASHTYYYRKEPKARNTTPPSPASLADAATSSTPCSATEPLPTPRTSSRLTNP